MVRQCAWCLCLINSAGERVSPSPLPKLYEASHGICGICGTQWMEQVIEAEEARVTPHGQQIEQIESRSVASYSGIEQRDIIKKHETVTELVMQLQQRPAKTSVSSVSQFKRPSNIKII